MTGQFEELKNSIVNENVDPTGVWHSHKDDVVISGISGRLPRSNNIDEFRKNLFEGVDCVTDKDGRWPPGIFGIPTRAGNIKDVNSFDANFFDIDPKYADVMDAQLRILMEVTFEAIVDAGYNPETLRGTKTGVFVGVSGIETQHFWSNYPEACDEKVLLGCYKSMFLAALTHAFDFKGPSVTVDTACSSSTYALHQAMIAMRNGECDAAIVAGTNLLLKITSSLLFQEMNMLSAEGACKTFDADGKGYVRAEAIVAIFLQKTKDARRIYATVVKTKINVDGYKVDGITFPKREMQYQLMRELYEESGINPLDVSYVEAHGTGTKVGDPEEVNAIVNVFCKDRKGPLLIGSVKSNMGHPEASSGLCGITKMIIAMEKGIIPPNLHYETPNPNIPGLLDGSLKVIDTLTPWNGGFAALSNFGFGGANAHILLHSNPKEKLQSVEETKLPKLVITSGRTREAVNCILDAARIHKQDDEFIGLLRDIYSDDIPKHRVRGFEVLNKPESRQIDNFDGSKKPIWFIFTGVGSQWEGMGRQLLCIESFRRSMERCAEIVKPKGVDLMNLILHGTDEMYDNVLNCFLSIVSIQICFVDMLKLLGIHPDGIIGHSIGEVGCAYADGSCTMEETILAVYWIGKVTLDLNLSPGSMAAIEMSWEEATKRCPSDIQPACDNSTDSVTIAGPTDSIHKFVNELQSEGIFAKVIKSCGLAFHSKSISYIRPKLSTALDKILPNPKKRTAKWISTSVPKKGWGSPIGQICSGTYFENNIMSPVLFHSATAYIPDNAIVLEVTPHSLFRTILRRSLPQTVQYLDLHSRTYPNNVEYFFSSVGKLYNAGAQPKISKLYPPVNYPVSRDTPMISPLIKWDHAIKWYVPDFAYILHSTENSVTVDLSKATDTYLTGHFINERILYPATGYIYLVWKTFANLNDTNCDKMPVVFENVHIHRATIIPPDGSVKFTISISNKTGKFEICEGTSVAVTGTIRCFNNVEKEKMDVLPSDPIIKSGLTQLSTKDIYKEFKLRGYDYKGLFQSIDSADDRGNFGEIKWVNNYITFMDGILQFSLLNKDTREMYLPTRLEYISINPILHVELVGEKGTLPIINYRNSQCFKSGGIEIRGLNATLAPRRQPNQPVPHLERYLFIPYSNNQQLAEDFDTAKMHALTVLFQIANENILRQNLKITEIACQRNVESLLMLDMMQILHGEPSISNINLQLITTSPDDYATVSEKFPVNIIDRDINKEPVGNDLHLIMAADMLGNKCLDILKNFSASLITGGFVIVEETATYDMNLLKETDFICVATQLSFEKTYLLLKKTEEKTNQIILHLTENNFHWIEELQAALAQQENKNDEVLLVNHGEKDFGMAGFMNCLKLENSKRKIRYFFIRDANAPEFSPTAQFYAEQVDKQLKANVLEDGQWGSYRHLRLEEKTNTVSREVEYAFINTLTTGDLSSLRWIESSLSLYKPKNHLDKEMCNIYYSSLNFRDIMMATGKLTPDSWGNLAARECVMGFEFSGRNSKGHRIMGMVTAQGLATAVLTDPLFTWKVPDKWTLEEAATIPVVYGTSYYALFVRDRLQPGESILIHAGSGGVGIASIALALHRGCKVFTTVGSNEKRNFLKATFPQLTDRDIGNTRDTSFEQFIMNETNGRGVDVILNSLAGEKLQAGIRCLAKNGRFLEIGKYDLASNTPLERDSFTNKTFHGILLDSLMASDLPDKKILVDLMNEGIENGAIRPLPTTVFHKDQVEQAFRHMAAGKHIGKVMIKIRDEEEDKVVVKPSRKTVMAIPRTYMDPDKSYILIGGLGGFGLELANWLVGYGAKHIVLTSRSGIRTGYQAWCVRRWRGFGANVVISTADCTTLAGAEELIKESNKIAPVGGIFNLAAILNDAFFENLNENTFKMVTLPKIDATKNLDRVSRKCCPSLDYFVVFSSLSSGRGNPGQTNYGLANSAMERIVERRKSNGLPGLAIQWGLIGDVGLVVETMMETDLILGRNCPERISSCLSTMGMFLQLPYPIVSSAVLKEFYKSSDDSKDLLIVDTIANILGITDVTTINPNSTLSDLGIDSLMSAEVKQTLERKYDLILSILEIRELTFGKLLESTSNNKDKQNTITPMPSSNDSADIASELLIQFTNAEVLSSVPLVQLETKSSNGPTLFLVPAIEGSLSPFIQMANEMEQPVWGFQYTKETPIDDITKTAKNHVMILKQMQKKGPYHIVGYSFGTIVAFEMALQLEKAGDKVTMTFIEGSPNLIKFYASRKTADSDADKKYSMGDFKRKIAFVANVLVPQISISQAYDILQSEATEEDALNKIVDHMKKERSESEKAKAFTKMILRKLEAIGFYTPNDKFSGKITLIRASETITPLDDTYGLAEICEQNVEVIEIAGNHRSVLLGDNAKKIASTFQV